MLVTCIAGVDFVNFRKTDQMANEEHGSPLPARLTVGFAVPQIKVRI